MAKSKMKRISASIPERVFDQLNALAEAEGRSISNLISYLLERCIDNRYEMNKSQGRISDNDGAFLDKNQ